MLLKFVILTVASFFVGLTIGLLVTNQNIGNSSPLVLTLSIVGPIVVLIRFILDYIKENSYEISQVVKTEEIRPIWEREGWSYKEKEKHDEIAFYLRITKKRGSGKLEDCEGIISLEIPTSTKIDRKSFPAVWRGPNYCRFRSIGLRDDLKLFHLSEDRKEILFFTHYDEGNNKIPTQIISSETDNEAMNTKITVKFAASKGNVPNKEFTSTVSKILNEAEEDF
jgi:hypothetical protein